MYYANIDDNLRIAYSVYYYNIPLGLMERYEGSGLELALNFKNGVKIAIEKVFDELYPQLDDNFVIVVVPPSNSTRNFKTSCHELCSKIIERAQQDGKNIIDGSRCIERVENIYYKRKEYTDNNNRNEKIRESMVLNNSQLIKGKDVLIIGDMITSGITLLEIRDKLVAKGAKNVMGFVVGKAEPNFRWRTGSYFVLGLDQVLFDTNHIKQYRDSGQWEKAIALAEECKVDQDIAMFMKRLYQVGSGVFIVTKAPRAYAEVFAEKLKFDTKYLISYNDGFNKGGEKEKWHKIFRKASMKAQNAIVIGDINSLIPDVKNMVTTIDVNWFKNNHVDNDADYKFNNVKDLMDNLDKITERNGIS